jgi:hypothetical protein
LAKKRLSAMLGDCKSHQVIAEVTKFIGRAKDG